MEYEKELIDILNIYSEFTWKKEPLDGDEVDRLVEHLRNQLNLINGNITQEEYDKAVNEYYEEHNKLPNSQQLQRLVQQNYYGMLDNTEDEECGEIETDEIVYNELPIKNLAQLSYSIYQDDSLIESEDKANECLKYLKENLQKVYDLIDMLDDGEYFEDEEKEVSKKRNEVDLYQIGDIINFIETIKIKKV